MPVKRKPAVPAPAKPLKSSFGRPPIKRHRIKRGQRSEAKVVIPSGEIIDTMTAIMAPIIKQIISNRIESRDLDTLHNTLLPKLLRGEINVYTAEEAEPKLTHK
jgi:hypothetical protein